MITDDPQVREKLQGAKERLAREFGDADANVSECFDRVVAELVAVARVPDFLPVLADRYARNCIETTSR